MKNRDIAEKIYEDLNKRGAGLGNGSISIIESSLDNLDKTENTPNELTAKSFLNDYCVDDLDVYGRHEEHYTLPHLMEEYASFKLQEANKKEILGDRKIVELEHDKTVLKAELKAKDVMLKKMADLLSNSYSDIKNHNAVKEILNQYKQGK